MLPKSIKYFQNIRLPYVDGIGRELSFLCRKKTHAQHLYENSMPEKV